MKAFLRALKFVWPYRYRIALGWFCAIMVAMLAFVGVGSILPLFKILFEENPDVVVGVDKGQDPAGQAVQVPFVVLPPDYTSRPAAGANVEIDRASHEVGVPAGYEIRHSGLMRLVERSQAKWYSSPVAWAINSLPEAKWKKLAVLMGFIVVVTALRSTFRFFNMALVSSVACRTVLDIRLRAVDHVLRLPMGFFHRGGGAEASSRLIQDAFALQEGVQALFGKVVTEPLQAVAFITWAVVLALQIDPKVLIVMAVIIPVCVIIIKRFAGKMRRATKKQLQSAARILGILEESMAGLRVVKAYTMEGRERRRFFREGREYLKQSIRAFRTQAASGPTLEFMAILSVSFAIVVAAYLLYSKDAGTRLNPGDIMLFFGALIGAMNPLRKLSDVNNRLQMAANAAERIFELIDAETEDRCGRLGLVLPRMSRELVFEKVGFHYSKEAGPVLRDVNLTVRAGEVVAIVGRTGCGKTTLANLIPRFYTPTEGRVVIDGQDLRDVTLRSIRDQIGLVSQDTILFSDTIANNIAYGSRPAMRARGDAGRVTREEIITAARMAHADEFIDKMPGGYDAELGTLGQTLSGGQRQRLALARAIIRNPAILILDEATSALDEQTQALVQDTLEKFVVGRTVLIIAHRMSTVALANRIVVMENGRIVDVGSHEELAKRCELYRRLRETSFEDL